MRVSHGWVGVGVVCSNCTMVSLFALGSLLFGRIADATALFFTLLVLIVAWWLWEAQAFKSGGGAAVVALRRVACIRAGLQLLLVPDFVVATKLKLLLEPLFIAEPPIPDYPLAGNLGAMEFWLAFVWSLSMAGYAMGSVLILWLIGKALSRPSIRRRAIQRNLWGSSP